MLEKDKLNEIVEAIKQFHISNKKNEYNIFCFHLPKEDHLNKFAIQLKIKQEDVIKYLPKIRIENNSILLIKYNKNESDEQTINRFLDVFGIVKKQLNDSDLIKWSVLISSSIPIAVIDTECFFEILPKTVMSYMVSYPTDREYFMPNSECKLIHPLAVEISNKIQGLLRTPEHLNAIAKLQIT